MLLCSLDTIKSYISRLKCGMRLQALADKECRLSLVKHVQLHFQYTYMYSKFIVYTCRKMATKATSKDSFGKESIVDDFMYGSNVATAHVYIRMGK